MARLIYQTDSTPQHRRMARRHIRLCGKINGAAAYGQTMQTSLDALIIKENERHRAEEQCEDALDDFTMKDEILDNQIRNLYEYTARFDRDHLTQHLSVLFQNKTVSDIVTLPISEKMLKVTQLIEKVPHLDAAEELKEYADLLQTAAHGVNAALDTRNGTTENLSRKQADEELACNAVRTQYESNYFDARKNFGKIKAELLFPKVSRKSSKSKSDKDESSDDE